MTDQRSRIERHIGATPGIHFNALVRALDLAPGQVQYHVKRLRRSEAIVEEHLYGRTHYYGPEYDATERRALALVRRETARDVLICLLGGSKATEGSNGMRPTDIADRLGIARSTLEWQVSRLTEQRLVRKEYDERNRVRLLLTDRERVVRLIERVEPSVLGRMTDRFVRLADRLLEDARVEE